MTIYKLGDTYYGARSNEFGYANYEIIPTPQIVINPLDGMTNQFAIELGLSEQQSGGSGQDFLARQAEEVEVQFPAN